MTILSKTFLAATIAAAALAGTQAQAVSYSIGNTGIGAYTVNGNTAAIVTNPVWDANTASSSWISVNSDGRGAPATTFNYATNFTVTGANGSNSILRLKLAADDRIANITLSGASGTRTVYTGNGSNGYPSLTPYTLNLGALANGQNTLTFAVYNARPGGDINPTGFRLETAAVPEPATWAMMVMGFGLVGAGIRSRRRIASFA